MQGNELIAVTKKNFLTTSDQSRHVLTACQSKLASSYTEGSVMKISFTSVEINGAIEKNEVDLNQYVAILGFITGQTRLCDKLNFSNINYKYVDQTLVDI